MRPPRNTAKTDPLLLLADAMTFGPSGSIERMEAQGQRELVASDVLPVETSGTDADFEALGFVFGKSVPGDPLFREATLPEGWERRVCDHAMYSDIVDETGTRRVSVFYKAASYDRKASMGLVNAD